MLIYSYKLQYMNYYLTLLKQMFLFYVPIYDTKFIRISEKNLMVLTDIFKIRVSILSVTSQGNKWYA